MSTPREDVTKLTIAVGLSAALLVTVAGVAVLANWWQPDPGRQENRLAWAVAVVTGLGLTGLGIASAVHLVRCCTGARQGRSG